MSRPRPRVLLSLTTAGVLLAGAAAHAQTGSARDTASVKRGYLFSAIRLADTDLGKEWTRLRGEATAKFPGLRLTLTEDLHVTVVYVGGGWRDQDLQALRTRARVAPATAARMTPEVVRMGRNDRVVAVEQHGAPRAWADSVVAARAALGRLGLRKPDRYDASFRTHVTLAQARHDAPTAADSTELAGFAAWLAERVAADPAKFAVEVGPKTRVELLLAGATRPEHAPEYVTVEEFLEAQAAPEAAR